MPAQYDDEFRAQCKRLYCFRSYEIPEIAVLKDLSESTLRRWRAEDDWDEQRLSRSVSGRDIAEQLRAQVYRIVSEANDEARTLTAGEVDSIRKMQKDIEKLDDSQIKVAYALDTFDDFGEWLAEHYPELRPKLITPIMEFTRELVKDA